MQLKNLALENFGRFPSRTFSFEKQFSIFTGCGARGIFSALRTVLGGGDFRRSLSLRPAKENFRIEAEFESDGAEYFAAAVCGENVRGKCVLRVCRGGVCLSAKEMRALLCNNEEEEECAQFICRPGPGGRLVAPDFSGRLRSYRRATMGEGAETFVGRTGGLGVTRTFRRALRGFCDRFVPLRIPSEQEMWLKMDGEKRFYAEAMPPQHPDGCGEAAFQYMCFLQTNSFWGEVRKGFGRGGAKPLLVCGLPECAAGSDLKQLLACAAPLGRQVFVFTAAEDAELRLAGAESVQIFSADGAQ